MHGPIELKIFLGHPRHIWNGLEFLGWALTKVLLTESDHHIIEYIVLLDRLLTEQDPIHRLYFK